jgi:Ca-activated chloride channel homolog
MKRVGGMKRSLRSFNRYSAAFADPMILVENMRPKHPAREKLGTRSPIQIDDASGARVRRKSILRSLFSPILIVPLAVLLVTVVDASHKASPSIVSPADEASLRVRVNSDLVQIPVTVTNKKDQVVEDLNKEIFLVYENGVQQTIAYFEPGEAPISVCLVFDSSGSMVNKLHKSVEAIHQLLDAAISDDEYCLVRFSDRPEIMVGITNGSAAVATAVNRIYAGGWTALLDAIYLGMQEVKRGHNHRKAIVLISDGGDNRSLHTRREITQLVREADAQIYSIGIISPPELLLHPEEIVGPALMNNLSHQSGGRLFRIHGIDELSSAVAKITMALRHQYVLGYYTKDAHNDGKYRRVTVKLNLPKGKSGLRAYWRAGYYARSE